MKNLYIYSNDCVLYRKKKRKSLLMIIVVPLIIVQDGNIKRIKKKRRLGC